MWILFLILGAALILVLCETWLGGDSASHAQDLQPGVQSIPARLTAWEASVKVVPLFLGGIGLPLMFAHPPSGILCLLLALGLFLVGRIFTT
jgi:hypothetical protein